MRGEEVRAQQFSDSEAVVSLTSESPAPLVSHSHGRGAVGR